MPFIRVCVLMCVLVAAAAFAADQMVSAAGIGWRHTHRQAAPAPIGA